MARVTLRAGETVRLTVRKHPLAVALPLAVAAFLLGIAFFLLVPLFAYGGSGVVAFVALATFALAIALRSWILWRSTVFLVTDQRVVDVDRTGVFRWVVTDVSYPNIADISYRIQGPLQAMLKAGNVLVTTVSGSNSIEASFVRDPGSVREAIVLHAREADGDDREDADKADDGDGGDALDDEDRRAVTRYADSLKKRKALRNFFDKGIGE